MNVAQAVVEVLKEQNARYVFGIPGGQTLFFTDALRDSGIEFLPTRHEGVAAGAADAYGRHTGQPGLCLATTGPGATNLLTAIGGALRDSSPVIAFLFQNTLAGAGRGDAQEANHEALFSSLVKKYIPIRHPDAAVWAMREAYRVAMSGKPGPVVVDFYRDVIEKGECDYTPVPKESYLTPSAILPTPETLEKLVSVLQGYEKVAIWSGNGVKMSHTGQQVLALAEKLNAPIVTTFNGISGVSMDHPLVFGARTRHGTSLTRAILEDADCLLVLGSSLSSVSTNRWGLKLKDIIQVDVVAEQIGKQYPVKLGVPAELSLVLPEITARLTANENPVQAQWVEDLKARRTAWKENVFSGPVNDGTATPAAPVALMRHMDSCLAPDDVICVDAGNPGAWSQLLNLKDTNRHYKPVNFGNMGFSIPACLATGLASPDKHIFGIIGDGSLGMTLGDLESLARYTDNVTMIVFNDHAYGNIKQEELFKFGEGHYQGVDLYKGADYAAVAAAFGFHVEKVTCANELPGAMERCRAHKGASFIHVEFDGSFTIWPEAFLWNL